MSSWLSLSPPGELWPEIMNRFCRRQSDRSIGVLAGTDTIANVSTSLGSLLSAP